MTVSSRGTRNHMASATDDEMAATQQTNSKAANEPSDSYVETKRQAVIEAREQALQAKAEAVRVKAQFRAEAIRAKAEEKASRTLAKAENRALKIEASPLRKWSARFVSMFTAVRSPLCAAGFMRRPLPCLWPQASY